MIHLLIASVAYVYVDNEAARGLVKLWAPQRIGNTLISVHGGVQAYARARVLLEDPDTFALFRYNPKTLVVCRQPGHVYVLGCLWSRDRVRCANELQQWFDQRDVFFHPLLPETDMLVWSEASHDL